MKRFFVLFLCVFFSSFSVKAGYSWTYQAEGLGMSLLEGQFNLSEDSGNYTAVLQTQSKGILSLFVDSKTAFFTRGIRKIDAFYPTESYMINTKKNRSRKRKVDLTQKDVLDYQTVVLNLLSQQVPTDAVYLISDGKRVMKATFLYQGKQAEDDVYSVKIDILSGRKTGWFVEQMKTQENPLQIFISTDPDTKQRVLKKALFNTGLLGKIVIYLIKGEHNETP